MPSRHEPSGDIARRRFLLGLASIGVVASAGFWGHTPQTEAATGEQQTLTGTRFALSIDEASVDFTGYRTRAIAINGSIPGPLLRLREGDNVTLAVTNRLRDTASIHWHGIRTPANMDGVPGLSFPGIRPGETFTYEFPVRQSGTYWYHSHSAFQEQSGLYGPLIIDPIHPAPARYDREYVVMLSDWSNEAPDTIFGNLKQQSSYYNFHQRTIGTFASDVRKMGLLPTLADRWMWGRMNMSPTDILDVSGATYTYLLNGQTAAENWTALFRLGERILLRFINGSAMTIFDVRIPGLPMTIVEADGNAIEPVTVDDFRISVAETYNAIITPTKDVAYTIFAQAEDRTGYARGTLAPRIGMAGAIPPMDPRPMRTMLDMGMGKMSGMSHGSAGMPTRPMPQMRMPEPSTMDDPAARTHAMNADDEPNLPTHGRAGHGNSGSKPSQGAAPPHEAQDKARGALHLSPEVDNIVEKPTERLATAGEGLGTRRALAYSDLRAVHRGTDARPPDRELELHLTGNMERFIWTFDGTKFSDAEPIRLQLGERVRIVLVNDSMMEHPMHLHGLWSELDNGNGEFRPYKHTVNVKPGERLSFLVSADTPGHWAFHCHLLYHMEAGMFRTVIVS